MVHSKLVDNPGYRYWILLLRFLFLITNMTSPNTRWGEVKSDKSNYSVGFYIRRLSRKILTTRKADEEKERKNGG